jgi:hypothetical protein
MYGAAFSGVMPNAFAIFSYVLKDLAVDVAIEPLLQRIHSAAQFGQRLVVAFLFGPQSFPKKMRAPLDIFGAPLSNFGNRIFLTRRAPLTISEHL